MKLRRRSRIGWVALFCVLVLFGVRAQAESPKESPTPERNSFVENWQNIRVVFTLVRTDDDGSREIGKYQLVLAADRGMQASMETERRVFLLGAGENGGPSLNPWYLGLRVSAKIVEAWGDRILLEGKVEGNLLENVPEGAFLTDISSILTIEQRFQVVLDPKLPLKTVASGDTTGGSIVTGIRAEFLK